MNNSYQMLENNLNREITLYEELSILYEEKRKLLINNVPEELESVDTKVINKSQEIKTAIEERLRIISEIKTTTDCLSDIIQECAKTDQAQANVLEEKRTQINRIVKKLQKQDKTNIELTKHGLKVSNKIMQIILNTAIAANAEYDKTGKAISQNDMQMSSISKEA